MKAPRLIHSLLLLSALAAVGCGAAPSGSEDGASLSQALDDAPDPDDGKACYQDVPMRKGVMSYGVCCFDDPVKGTSECIICDAAHTCTKGGATPGALTAQTGSIISAGTLVVSGGSNWKPPNTAVVGTHLTTSAKTK